MRSDALVQPWQELREQTSFPKHLAAGGCVLIFLFNYALFDSLTQLFHVGSFFAGWILLYVVISYQEQKKFDFIYSMWEKSQNDIRYEIALHHLYDCFD